MNSMRTPPATKYVCFAEQGVSYIWLDATPLRQNLDLHQKKKRTGYQTVSQSVTVRYS